MTIVFNDPSNNHGTWGAVYAPFLHAELAWLYPHRFSFPAFFYLLWALLSPLRIKTKQQQANTINKITVQKFKTNRIGLFS